MKSTTGRIASIAGNFQRLSTSITLVVCVLATNQDSAIADQPADWDATDFQRLTKDEIRAFGRKRGDIVSRGDLPRLFALLQRRGVPAAQNVQSAVAARILPDSDLMVHYLRTRRGTTLMRQITRYPNAFDRLDRLVRMPYGAVRMRELIRGPDGYKLIEYMTTSRGGRNLGEMLSRTRSGRNFNRKTGQLYTVRDVIMFVTKRQQVPRGG